VVSRRANFSLGEELSLVSRLDGNTHQSRVAAITGAGSGIGEATAYRLSKDGFEVAVLDIDLARAENVAQNIAARGGSSLPVRIDVARLESVESAFRAIEEWRKPTDVLVNSAGILRIASVIDCRLPEFEEVMQVNVTGSFLCAQRAAKGMIAQKYGRIINLSSIGAVRAGVGRIAYGTSKGAVSALTRQLAFELGGFGITANSVAPGPISTPMTREFYTHETRDIFESMIPMCRLGTVDEVADAIAFLSSEAAGYINGVMLAIDGGYLAAGIGTTGDLHSP
jgi:3-oxoacyl-[acyl-carrier protein] reductase